MLEVMLFDSCVIFPQVFLVRFPALRLLNSHLGCYKFPASSQDSLRDAYSPAAWSRRRYEQGYQPWLHLGLHSGSVSLIHQADYCAVEPPTLDPTINHRSTRSRIAVHVLQISVFYGNNRKKYCLGFRISDFKQDFSSDFSIYVQDFSLLRTPRLWHRSTKIL